MPINQQNLKPSAVTIPESKIKEIITLFQSMLAPVEDEENIIRTYKGDGGVRINFKINKKTKHMSMWSGKGDTVLRFENRKITTFQGFVECMQKALDAANGKKELSE